MEALTRIRESIPQSRVAVISATEDAEKVRAALEAGASGYLPKTLLPKTMAAALRAILEGQRYSPLD
jgi:DNA-binding NarL/FixJ family response regulator